MSYSDDITCGIPVWVWITILAALIIGAIWWDAADTHNWEQFSAAHDCKHVGHQRGHYNVGFGKGNDGEWVSATDSYLCDDGITYTR